MGDTIAATAFKILIRKIKSQAQWVQLVDSFFQNSPTSNYNEQTFSWEIKGALCSRITHFGECEIASLHFKLIQLNLRNTGTAVEKNFVAVSIIIEYRYLIQETTQKKIICFIRLSFSTQVRGFKPGRSRRIFKGRKKSSARLPSEGK